MTTWRGNVELTDEKVYAALHKLFGKEWNGVFMRDSFRQAYRAGYDAAPSAATPAPNAEATRMIAWLRAQHCRSFVGGTCSDEGDCACVMDERVAATLSRLSIECSELTDLLGLNARAPAPAVSAPDALTTGDNYGKEKSEQEKGEQIEAAERSQTQGASSRYAPLRAESVLSGQRSVAVSAPDARLSEPAGDQDVWDPAMAASVIEIQERRITEISEHYAAMSKVARDAELLAQQRGERIASLEAALNDIASWGEGAEVSGSFDEPGSAKMARRALAAQDKDANEAR